MQFKLKVQFIPNKVDKEKIDNKINTISLTHEFTPTSTKAFDKKGKLYIALNLNSETKEDLVSLASLFFDSIGENYYQIDNETPIHSIEKTLKKSLNIIAHANQNQPGVTTSKDSTTTFSFCTAIIWKRVLYVSHYGNCAAYLIRGSGSRNLITNPVTNELWTNSSLLLDNDVVIIGTEQFSKDYPVNKIVERLGKLSSSLEENPHKNKIAAVIIKISDATHNNKNITLLEKLTSMTNIGRVAFSKLSNTIKNSNDKSLHEEFKKYQAKKSSPVLSINSLMLESKNKTHLTNKSTYKRLKNFRGKKNKKKVMKRALVVLLSILAVSSISYITYFKQSNNKKLQTPVNDTEIVLNNNLAQIQGTQTTSGIEEISAELFVDIKDHIESVSPISLAILNTNHLLFVNNDNGSIYSITRDVETDETKINEAFSDDLFNPSLLTCASTLCYVVDEPSMIIFEPGKEGEPIALDKIKDVVDIDTYSSRVYLATINDIYVFDVVNNTNKQFSKWNNETQDEILSISVDSQIYTLQNRGDVFRYTSGNKEEASRFELSDNSYLLEPKQIRLYVDDTVKLLILEDTSKSIIKYDWNGNFLKEINLIAKESDKTIKSFVTDSDGNIYFLSGSKVYIKRQ